VLNLQRVYAVESCRSCADRTTRIMSYNVTLGCSCRVYVSVDPRTDVAHTRVIESRGDACRDRHHDIGTRLRLREVLPDERSQPPVVEHLRG
jgi:hypothetical protein